MQMHSDDAFWRGSGASSSSPPWPVDQLVLMWTAQDHGWAVRFELLDELRCACCRRALIEGEQVSRSVYFTRTSQIVPVLLCPACSAEMAGCRARRHAVSREVELRFAPTGGLS
jgi:hypothetical protein